MFTIYLIHKQKSPITCRRRGFYSKSEISMKQTHLKSQTTQYLNQPPTAENTIQYRSSGLAIPSILVLILLAMLAGGVFSCSGYQSATAKMGVK